MDHLQLEAKVRDAAVWYINFNKIWARIRVGRVNGSFQLESQNLPAIQSLLESLLRSLALRSPTVE